jgi:hypothetical protein
MKQSTRNALDLTWEFGLLVLVAIAVLCVAWVFPSYMEARAYNHATGAHVSTWDAMFVDLRVQDGAK